MSDLAPCGMTAFRRVLAAATPIVGEETHASGADNTSDTVGSHQFRSLAAAILGISRARRSRFPLVRLRDPSWEIMLDLYVCARANLPVSVSDACLNAGVPISTALHHIQILVELGYVRRVTDRIDRRRTFLEASGTLAAGLEALFAEQLGCLQRHG